MSILSAVCAFGQMIYDSVAAVGSSSDANSEIYCNDYNDWQYDNNDFCENVSTKY